MFDQRQNSTDTQDHRTLVDLLGGRVRAEPQAWQPQVRGVPRRPTTAVRNLVDEPVSPPLIFLPREGLRTGDVELRSVSALHERNGEQRQNGSWPPRLARPGCRAQEQRPQTVDR